MSMTDNNPQETSSEAALSRDWVETHADYLFNFAVGQVRDAGVAEDLVQETFLAALKSQNGFSGRSTERTWLVGILRHKICDHLRKTCRERAVRVDPTPTASDDRAYDESVLWVHQVADELQSPSRRMELHEFRENLKLALASSRPGSPRFFSFTPSRNAPTTKSARNSTFRRATCG